MVARWVLLFFLSISYAQAQDITGDLNTNIQGSTVDSNNESESITNNYNSGAPGRESNPVPTAMAPTIMGSGGNDSCLIAKSSGLQVSLFGVARGGMEQDERCNLRKNARLLGAPQAVGGLGLQVSGISVLCRDQEIFKAMALANTPCPINDVSTGKLLVGRDAFVKYRSNPALFVVGYELNPEFWDELLLIGEELPDVPKATNSLSLSDRFRSNSRSNLSRPSDYSERDSGASEPVQDVDGG